MGNSAYNEPRPDGKTEALEDEIRALRRELVAFRRIFDEFANVFLNTRFPFGQPVDRWRRRV
jgi:hypothetical protein